MKNYEYTPEQQREDQEEVVNCIINMRERLGLDQEWVADQAGYSITQYLRIEKGERYIDHEDLVRIGMVLCDYQESLLPPYRRILNQLLMPFQVMLYRLGGWLERCRGV